jgi:HEAT repeat protein
MALRHTEEEQAEFARALQSVSDEGPLPQTEVDALSMLEGDDLARFRDVWSKLPAGARARLILALRGAAEQRLRLDFSALNRLALDDADAQVRLAGAQSTLEDNSPELLRKLLDLVGSDPSIDVRSVAAEDVARFALLAELEDLDAETSAQLKASLREVVRDKNQRLGAVRGMGRNADSRWTDRLMPVLGSDDPQLREAAAHALGEIEDERAVTPLVELVDDPEPEVRLAVIQALGHIGGEDAREALLYLAESAEDPIREAAEHALEEIEAAEADPLDL